MTAIFRQSRARKQAERARKKASRTSRWAIEPEPGLETLPPQEYFTPTSPEPTPLYNFLEEWNRGILPGNHKLLKFLDSWQTSPILASDPRLSSAGLALVADLRELGATLAKIIRERNSDELLQRFVGHLRLSGRVIKRGQRSGRITLVEDLPNRRRFRIFGRRDAQVQRELVVRKVQAKKDIQDLLTLGQLVITSVDFRNMVGEMQQIVTRAINLKPKEGRTSQVPVIEREPQITSKEGKESDIEDLRRQTISMREEVHQLRERTTTGISASYAFGSSQEQRVPSFEFHPPSSLRAPVAEPSIAPQAEFIASKPEPSSTAIYAEEGIDPIEKLLNDSRVIFKKLAENATFREAIDGIYDILVRWQSSAPTLAGTVLPNDLRYDANFQAAQQDLLLLMERFANGANLRPLVNSIAQIRAEALKDYELLDFLQDWRAFFSTCTSDSAYLDHQEYRNRGRYLLERTADYGEKKYRKLFQDNIQSWNEFMQGWQSDKLTTELGRVVTRIFAQDLFGQATGPAAGVSGALGGGFLSFAQIQSSLLKDLQNVILPAILRELYELPLPHMELEQGSMKASFDDVVLPAQLLAPSVLDVRTAHRLHISPRDRLLNLTHRATRRTKESQWQTGTRLVLTGMKGEVKNVRFAMARTAWPRLRDRGRVDVRLGGRDGLSVILDLATELQAAERVFHVNPVYVKVKLSRLALKFYDIQHDTFFAIMRPYMQTMMKKRIERALCDRIVLTIEQFNRITRRLAKSTAIPS